MKARILLATLFVAIVSACIRPRCPEGLVESQGGCVDPELDGGSLGRPCAEGCSGSTPVCNPRTLRCVACLASDDCSDPSKPLCEQRSHRCVSCLASTDCRDPARPVCSPSSGECRGCNGPSDCLDPAHPYCAVATGACVECLTTGECDDPSEPFCDADRGSCIECRSGSDCHDATRPLCRPGSQDCVECLSRTDCLDASRPACETSSGRCVACVAASDCPDARLGACDPSTHLCRTCTSDAECAGRPDTPVCDVPSGACVACTAATAAERCGTNSCDALTHTCTSTPRGSLPSCAVCRSSDECVAGLRCVSDDPNPATAEYFCLPGTIGTSQCPSTSDPFSVIADGHAIEAWSRVVFCAPRASCPAFVDYRARKPCTSATECADEGMCALSGSRRSTCTLDCSDGFGSFYPRCLPGDSCTQVQTGLGKVVTQCVSP